MNHDIAFLHTSNVHAPTFQKIMDSFDSSITVRHDVDESLLAEALANGLTNELANKVDNAMTTAADSGASVIVCTCSTIGGIAEKSSQISPALSMRIDRAMADTAVSNYHQILIVAAVESTLEPSRILLEESSRMAARFPHMSLSFIDAAWSFFEDGDLDAYYTCIEQYIQQHHAGYDCIVLAQASMAPVANRFQNQAEYPSIIASPKLGVKSAIEQFQRIGAS